MREAIVEAPHYVVRLPPLEAMLKINIEGVAILVQYFTVYPDVIVVNLQGEVG